LIQEVPDDGAILKDGFACSMSLLGNATNLHGKTMAAAFGILAFGRGES
jgi:hypothetical protein